MERIPASERTREHLKALMEGKSPVREASSELVRLAARLVIEEALEGEAADALGRGYYARGAQPGLGYRKGYRMGRLKTAEGAVQFATPHCRSGRAVPLADPRNPCPADGGVGSAGTGLGTRHKQREPLRVEQ
jgi:putative transposase